MSSGTQMESPRACQKCDGAGFVLVLDDSCRHGGQICPCDVHEVTCPRCEGSRVEGCDVCGEPSSIRYLRRDLCLECAPAEEQRFDSCSICDRPIDLRELSVPLCSSCRSTAEAAGQYAANAQRYPDPERRSA